MLHRRSQSPALGGTQQPSSLLAQVAQHGPLYERVSFNNQPQWRAANEPLWNAYRLASLSRQRSQLTAIVLDILAAAAARARQATQVGLGGEATRRRWNETSAAERGRAAAGAIRLPRPRHDRTAAGTDVDRHNGAHSSTGWIRAPKTSGAPSLGAVRTQAADTTDADSDAETAADEERTARTAANSEDECDEPFPHSEPADSQTLHGRPRQQSGPASGLAGAVRPDAQGGAGTALNNAHG